MTKVSRRSLARWAASQISAGQPAKNIARHLAAVLAEGKMLDQTDFLLSDIAWELEHRNTLAVGKIISARPITIELESALKSQIKAATKAAEVSLEKVVDKSVIGGVRVETASRVWDQTVSRKLAELKEVF